MKYVLKSCIVFLCILFSVIGCKKSSVDSNTETKNLSVFLTDAPPPQFDSVFIDIRYVEVKVDADKEHKNDDHFGDNDADNDDDHLHHDKYGDWDTLSIQPGVYNLMRFRNGVNMLLGTGNITGKIRKIRITLGSNNSVYIAGTQYPLSLRPDKNNYLYVKIHNEDKDEDNNNANIWLDFDLSRSLEEKNGQFYLNPVLKPFGKKNYGAVQGQVFPFAARPVVIVYNVNDFQDATHGIPETDGKYDVEGLHPGTYHVEFHGFNGYRDTTLLNIVIQKGKKTELPTITLVN